jgi:hypothetical protein
MQSSPMISPSVMDQQSPSMPLLSEKPAKGFRQRDHWMEQMLINITLHFHNMQSVELLVHASYDVATFSPEPDRRHNQCPRGGNVQGGVFFSLGKVWKGPRDLEI